KLDQAAMARWIPHGDKQENTEREIKTHHHRVSGIRIRRIPYTADGWINGRRKQQPHQHQYDLQSPFSKHRTSSCPNLEQTLYECNRDFATTMSSLGLILPASLKKGLD